MFRYVAVCWDPSSTSELEAANIVMRRLHGPSRPWTLALDRPGLKVSYTGHSYQTGDVIPLFQHKGIALGTVFQSNANGRGGCSQRVIKLDEGTSAEVIRTSGRSLISTHWGSYVLFLPSSETNRTTVLRGPVGALPCLWTVYRNITVFFSDVADWVALGLARLSVNWDCVRAQAALGDFLGQETAINEIGTVVSGECLKLGGGSLSRELYWNPSKFRSDELMELPDAANLIRNTGQDCINAWTSPHEKILLQLSGGLDSSILLSCMCRSPTLPEVISVNLWNRGSGDERHYARSMTDKTATELLEFERDQNVDLSRLLNCALTANPVLNFSAYDTEPRLISLAHERKATAIFTGEVGDDIFGHASSPPVLAECLRSRFPTFEFLDAAIDYAELNRITVWQAVRSAIRYKKWQLRTHYWSFYRYNRFVGFEEEQSLVSEAVGRAYEETLPRFVHPWLQNVSEMPLGLTMLIFALVTATSAWSHSPFGGEDASLFMTPLASQPLVESFSTIPSKLHFLAGENGAVARLAFREDLSAMVLERGTGKGTIDLWIQDLLAQNRNFLKSLLLDGILVRERILDRRKVELALSGSVSRSRVGVAEIMMQCYIEAWLRRWDAVNHSRAAA